MKFKKGDKVKLIRGSHSSGSLLGIHTVKEDDEGLYIEDPVQLCRHIEDWELAGKEVKMKGIKWAIKYDRNEDPTEYFKTKKLAEKRIEELLDDSGVDKKEIYLFQVGKVFKVDRPVSFDLVEQ